MKNIFLNLVLILVSSSFTTAQNIQHSSVDIPNPTAFYESQEQANWCWAACNQMLLSSQGIEESQENQVMKLYGQLTDRGAGADYEKAKLALRGTYTDSSGNDIKVTPYISYLGTHNNDAIVIIEQLQKGIPLIMATKQHGRVCVGVDYNIYGTRYQITHLRLLNPDPHISDNIETYTMQEYLSLYSEGGLIGFMTINIH